MKIPSYSKERMSEEFWTDLWGEEELDRLLSVARDSYLTEILIKHLPKEGKILEAGCGLGQYVILLKELGYDIEGIDYSKYSVKRCKAYDKLANVKVMDVKDLGYKKHSIEAYISLGVIEHFENEQEQDKILQEANRVLSNEGELILSVPYINYVRYLLYPLFKINNQIEKKNGARFHQYHYSKKEVESILSRNGFKIEFFYPYNPGRWFNNMLKSFRVGNANVNVRSSEVDYARQKNSPHNRNLTTRLLYNKISLSMFSHMLLTVSRKI